MPSYTMEHIHLFSRDAIAAGKFYTDTFGVEAKEVKTSEGLPLCYIRLGGLIVLISTVEGDMQEMAADHTRQLGINHFALRVEDLDAVHEDLTAKGIQFTVEPKEIPGARIAFIQGPDRVSIEFVQYT